MKLSSVLGIKSISGSVSNFGFANKQQTLCFPPTAFWLWVTQEKKVNLALQGAQKDFKKWNHVIESLCFVP